MYIPAVCRDQDDLVTVEAIKALFGQLPPYNPSLMTGATALTPQEELVSNRMRIRAWSMVSSQASNLRVALTCLSSSLQMLTYTLTARLLSRCYFVSNHLACYSFILIHHANSPCAMPVEMSCAHPHDGNFV
jgi:hypothetical protein